MITTYNTHLTRAHEIQVDVVDSVIGPLGLEYENEQWFAWTYLPLRLEGRYRCS